MPPIADRQGPGQRDISKQCLDRRQPAGATLKFASIMVDASVDCSAVRRDAFGKTSSSRSTTCLHGRRRSRAIGRRGHRVVLRTKQLPGLTTTRTHRAATTSRDSLRPITDTGCRRARDTNFNREIPSARQPNIPMSGNPARNPAIASAVSNPLKSRALPPTNQQSASPIPPACKLADFLTLVVWCKPHSAQLSAARRSFAYLLA